MLVTSTKKVVGLSSGRVMRKKRRTGPAPSIMAASYRFWGMPCRPARKMTIW